MKDRIIQFLGAEKISPAEFADKIGVQRSSMSHILNGRNYPSASFLQKMLQAYPALNPRWLMIGDGTMNTGPSVTALPAGPEPEFHQDELAGESQTTLFQEQENPVSSVPEAKNTPSLTVTEEHRPGTGGTPPSEPVLNQTSPASGGSEAREKVVMQPDQSSPQTHEPSNGKEIEQVLFFFKDKTFTVYRPS
jgi:transcriptional regulator with XRE-family HTH domain